MAQPGVPTAPSAPRPHEMARLGAMMGLFFLVVCSVGILRPIRNSLALDGLGRTDFYKVYLVSAVVVLFVPLYNRLADRVAWRWLIPAVAVFFSLNLLFFRAIYVEGSTAFGLVFYGWYDLFAAALVTQFFMATQIFFDARLARRAYPVVIAGGSIGATLGGAITGFFAEAVGTPNLLIVAAVLIGLFSVGVPLVWVEDAAVRRGRRVRGSRDERSRTGELRRIARNRQVRLIAVMVLLTVVVKQLVDYQFNTLTKEVFLERDAISAFQGKFNAATQWLPIVVLAALHPMLRRWGVGVAVLLLPVAMVLTNFGLVLFFGLWAAVAAKGAETALRYSAERTGREILYVPVPEEIKLKAKTYIDVGLEKGVGKVASALLIPLLLMVMEFRYIALVGMGLALAWMVLAIAARREYVRTLARAMEGRFASLRGVFTSLADASTVPVLRRALRGDEVGAAFALDLVRQAPPDGLNGLGPELRELVDHPSPGIRARALGLLERSPTLADVQALRRRLGDPEADVREAAVRTLAAGDPRGPAAVVEELLAAPEPEVRSAVLACLGRGELGREALDVVRRVYGERSPSPADSAPARERAELALAAAALGREGGGATVLEPLLDDPDPMVASTALRSAGLLGEPRLLRPIVSALRDPATREAARDAIALQGAQAVPLLAERLLDEDEDPTVRRTIPSVLARIPAVETVDALVRCALAPETDQVLDYRSIKALSKLRARNPGLAFEPAVVQDLLDGEVEAARRYADALASLRRRQGAGPAVRLLARALDEAWAERREGSFRALGLLHPPDDVYRSYLAVVRGERIPRANALEWLETTVGRGVFIHLQPVLAPHADGRERGDPAPVLASLEDDQDTWLAHCASRARRELGLSPPSPDGPGADSMDLIEKVFLLQQVDVLQDARSAHLALLASIAEEVDVDAGVVLVREGEPTDALYVVIRGAVELRGAGGELRATDGTAFGAWALIDEAPSLVEGRAAEATRLLRIDRAEFYDLLADYPELAIGLLQGLARRMRSLVA